MRVEVYRDTVHVNMAILRASSGAEKEFYRVALAARWSNIKTYVEAAKAQGLVFITGIEILDFDSSTAVISIYLNIKDDAAAIYYKLSIDPTIIKVNT